jgi:hypothetical protein
MNEVCFCEDLHERVSETGGFADGIGKRAIDDIRCVELLLDQA